MAATRLQIGSPAWIADERTSTQSFIKQEKEDFSFAAKNELEWLNEHMADVFNENQINVADIFKTPGKLRGKTPRTVRKRSPLSVRSPLNDIFSATPKPTPKTIRQPLLKKQIPRFKVAEDEPSTSRQISPRKEQPLVTHFDSGYHGSQPSNSNHSEDETQTQSFTQPIQVSVPTETEMDDDVEGSSAERTIESSFRSAEEEMVIEKEGTIERGDCHTTDSAEDLMGMTRATFSTQHLPIASGRSPDIYNVVPTQTSELALEHARSPSEMSSPIRPTVRKSSLSFATLPPREIKTAKTSIDHRASRTSSEHPRMSLHKRQTGKASGECQRSAFVEHEMGVPSPALSGAASPELTSKLHNKTSTQRLQDQISMLGQTQTHQPRTSKSIPSLTVAAQMLAPQDETQRAFATSESLMTAPRAFPEDDDDWIGPPASIPTPTPPLAVIPAPMRAAWTPKSTRTHEGGDAVVSTVQEVDGLRNVPKQRSPAREVDAYMASPRGYMKSASTSVIASPTKDDESLRQISRKPVAVSNPPLQSASAPAQRSPSKSPSKILRDSPLKAAKDKISSILKTSKGLFASSAAASAEAYSSTLSSTSARLPLQALHSASPRQAVMQPDSGAAIVVSVKNSLRQENMRRTRASMEKERKQEKEEEEARMMQDQLDRLERVREQESHKAKLFSQEQEKTAVVRTQINTAKPDKVSTANIEIGLPLYNTNVNEDKTHLEEATPALGQGKSASVNAEREITDLKTMAPPPLERNFEAKSGKDQIKRAPKDPLQAALRDSKPAAPVQIKVQTGVHGTATRNPIHPSNMALSSSLAESLGPSGSGSSTIPDKQGVLNHKQSSSSFSSLKTSTTKKPAALVAAARKKEQDELVQQKRREEKLETQRRRAALDDERRQEQNKVELDKKREQQKQPGESTKYRENLERAKTERPPPPAPRPLPRLETNVINMHDKPLPMVPAVRMDSNPVRKPIRMNSTMHRPQDETGPSLQILVKTAPKRPLLQESDTASRPQLPRNGPSYTQQNDKRRRTGDETQESTQQSRPTTQHSIRQSAVRPPKDGQSRSIFASGYVIAPPNYTNPSLLQQATRSAQQSKAAHPMDMTHNSKAAIHFATNPAQNAQNAHKTPARPAIQAASKSSIKQPAKSSPHYPKGDNIDLPEIHTDSEDEDSDAEKNDFAIPDWANSPNLAQGLMVQERLDPVSVFGRPGELRMEEVFKNKERWGRFRARTSSANWSGSDRLTDEEIKKDVEARERLRKEGGWSFGLS